jgi:DNA repair exonuclease SbcCD ATPase subunit
MATDTGTDDTTGTENDDDDDAQRLLDDAINNKDVKNDRDDSDGDDSGDTDREGSSRTDQAASADLDRLRRQLKAANREAAKYRTQVKDYQDKDKSESQRLTEAAEEAKSRASGAEQKFRKLQTAIDRAPEGASLAQIRAVAKRLHGDTDEEMEDDADELFALLAPKPAEGKDKTKPPAGKPKANLRGGGDPDDEPEEMDPRKLAAQIGRY